MTEELCPKCRHPIGHHSKNCLSGCNEKLSVHPNEWCTCYETQETIKLRNDLNSAIEKLIDLNTKIEKLIASEIDEHLKVVNLQSKVDIATDIFHKLDNWTKAYPLDIFPEPDLKRARLILESHRMSLDSISASAMRHVVNGIKDYVEQALKELE